MVVTLGQPAELLADLTPTQHLAVTTPSPTVCVLASAGASERRPAPPSVLKALKGAKGKSYEEKSLNLPDVVETG